MEETKQCPECGSPVRESGPAGGLCPRCLMRGGLNDQRTTVTGGGTAAFAPPSPDELADRFPQLEILELIGHGGMGAVYKARQPALDRVVALKILAPGRVRDAAFAERFGREARTLARLNHPHIVAIHDVGETDGLYYFVMEYVDGASLREVMEAGRLSPAAALELVPQLCEALQFAHEAGVVHRDIKPGNILLDRSGRVKIADFGLAKLVEPQPVDGVSLTGSGAVMGTPAYMAPEQIEHPLDVDHRADIFGLGVVFYEMLTGELPLGRFDPPSSKVRLDVRLDQVVLRTLEKEPNRRYQLARDVKTDLESIDGSMMVEGSGPAAPAPPPGMRTVNVTRPSLVTWIATYSFVMGALLPATTGLTLMASLIGARWHASPVSALAGIGRLSDTSWSFFILTTAAALFVIFGVLHLVAGFGALRLRNWSRYLLIVLAVFELPGSVFPILSWATFWLLPSTFASVLILVHLFRRPVARVFELGLGPATLPTEEADSIERL